MANKDVREIAIKDVHFFVKNIQKNKERETQLKMVFRFSFSFLSFFTSEGSSFPVSNTFSALARNSFFQCVIRFG